MKVYFVRHGEGVHNANHLYSYPEAPLTDKGMQQAKFAGKRIKTLPIELIISSPYKRTVQTTNIINKNLNKKVIYNDLAVEIRRPTEISGKNRYDPDIIKIKKQLDKHFHLPNWHFSDEENFYDLRKRAFVFITYLQSLKQQQVLVVTHMVFIQAVVLTMMLGEKLTASVLLRAYKFFFLETSGLTLCEYKDNDWKLITWNDISHLADSSNGFSG